MMLTPAAHIGSIFFKVTSKSVLDVERPTVYLVTRIAKMAESKSRDSFKNYFCCKSPVIKLLFLIC